MVDDLKARLRSTKTKFRMQYEEETREVLTNPDGPEAADRMEQLEAENGRLATYAREASRALNKLSGGGSEMFKRIGDEFYADPTLAIERTEHRIAIFERLVERRAALALRPGGESPQPFDRRAHDAEA